MNNNHDKIVADILHKLMNNPDEHYGISIVDEGVRYVLNALGTAGALSHPMLDDLLIFNSTEMMFNYNVIELKELKELNEEDKFHLMLLNAADYDKYCMVLEILSTYTGSKTTIANLKAIMNKI